MPLQPIASSGIPGRTVYFPEITTAKVAKQFLFGPYRAALLTDCESPSSVSYIYALYVRKQEDSVPLLVIASEIRDDIGDKTEYCLAMFYQGRHYNFGFSKDWLDAQRFTEEALAVAMQYLSYSGSMQELSPESDAGFDLPFLK